MKNLITLVLIVLMSTELMAYSGGSGTIEDPYQIAVLADLNELSSTYGDWDKHYIQTNNINASATVNQDSGAGFMPIGREGIYFTGTYDGNGYTIDSLYINRPSMDYVGLFSYPYRATIENLGVTNVNVTGNNAVGALAGLNATGSLINNCYSTGSVTGYEKAGGLAGENYNNSTINNSYSTCTVKATTWYYAGGFVGLNFSSNSTIYNCYSTGDVEGQEYVGGFVGSNNFATSTYSCYSTGNVRATNNAGGFIGLNTNSSSMVHDCYSLGDVTLISNQSNPNIGGFCGWNNETIGNCYSVGSVFYEGSTNPTNRGFLGHKGTGSVYNNNFFDNESSNQTSDEYEGATAKSTAEMKNEATFTDLNTVGLTTAWDFAGNPFDDQGNDDYWALDRSGAMNNGYPYLSWQNGSVSALTNKEPIIQNFNLEQNYPNPFNPTTVIRFQLPAASHVKLKIFNLQGQEIKTIVNQRQEAGSYRVTLNAAGLASGIYIYQLKTQSGFISAKKMMLIR